MYITLSPLGMLVWTSVSAGLGVALTLSIQRSWKRSLSYRQSSFKKVFNREI
jgi:hypothetical protein